MSAKMATLGLLKREVFRNKCCDVLVSVHDVINKISSRDSNYIVDVVKWPKFGNSSISVETYHNSNFIRIWQEKSLFEGWYWLEFNNLGLALGMALKFCTNMTKSWN